MPKPGEEVDLASKLEDYLLKICSGEITGSNASLNLAEVASLLQGSVQVYSRKVQYLYNVVLHSLETLSQNRPEQSEGTSGSHAVSDEEEGTSVSDEEEGTSVSDEEEGTSVSDEEEGTSVSDEEDDQFWCPDDVPVEANNSLDASTSEDASFYPFVKPPAAATLVVLEGDCLDTSGDGGELESYQLATYDLYRDFILLDPCDSVAVDDFLKGDEIGKVPNRPLVADYSVGVNNCNVEPDLPALDDGCLEPENLEDSEDDDDNPGNLEDSEDDDDNDGAQGICNLNLD